MKKCAPSGFCPGRKTPSGTAVLGQCPAPAALLCSMQGLTLNREKQTNLGVIFLSMEVSPFSSLLSFHCREGALPSSTMWASLTTCCSSFLPVSVTESYAHSSSPGPVDAFMQKIITVISLDQFGVTEPPVSQPLLTWAVVSWLKPSYIFHQWLVMPPGFPISSYKFLLPLCLCEED